MTDLDPRTVLNTLNERVLMPRVGLSVWREMDRDIVAMRDAAQVIADILTPDRDAIIQVLREQGLDTGGASPHSWRCEHPDRYPGYCTCVEETADAIVNLLTRVDPMDVADQDQEERDTTFGSDA